MDIFEELKNRFKAEYIYSRSNAAVVSLAKLSDRKHRDDTGLFLAEGTKLAEESLDSGNCAVLVISEESGEDPGKIGNLAEKALKKDVRLIVMSGPAFEKISTEKSPQGILTANRTPEEPDIRGLSDAGFAVYLDSVRDPGNFGTILSSAEAFGAGFVLAESCADTGNPRTVRASMGAVFRIPVITVGCREKLAFLRDKGWEITGMTLAEDSLELGSFTVRDRTCFVIGNEGHGISEGVLSLCTSTARIPMTGKAESLNAAQACTVALWEAARTAHGGR